MNVVDLLNIGQNGVITTADFRNSARERGIKWQSMLCNITRWVREGIFQRVTRGYFIAGNSQVDPKVISCGIITDGYVSFETALSSYGMILEQVYSIDVACPRRIASFSVRDVQVRAVKIPPSLFWGYELKQTGNNYYRIASPHKALFDRLYMDKSARPVPEYFEEMRLEQGMLDLDEFTAISDVSTKIKKFVSPLKEYLNE
jgi:predicted transcriptional regulator of viral defense system